MPLETVLSDLSKQYKALHKSATAYTPFTSLHIFSNELKKPVIYDLLLAEKSLKVPGKNNMAVVIGESSFLSFAPVFAKHVDTVLLVDIDTRTIEHNKYMLECLTKAANRTEFVALFCGTKHNNPIINAKIMLPYMSFMQIKDGKLHTERQGPRLLNLDEFSNILSGNMKLLDGKHFLQTDENYRAVKAAVAKLTFHFIELDFFNFNLMASLREKLIALNVHIPLVNVSNLFDYDGPFALRDNDQKKVWQTNGHLYQSLGALLTRPEETFIMYSHMDETVEYRTLKCCLANSLGQFKEETGVYSDAYSASLVLQRKTGRMLYLKPAKPRDAFFKPAEEVLPAEFEPTIMKAMEAFLAKRFPGSQLACRKIPGGHFFIDMLITASETNAQELIELFKQNNLCYRKEYSANGAAVIRLLEINVHGNDIHKMIQTCEGKRPRP